MKKIDHNYWVGEYAGTDADFCNPDLRTAMKELYGRKGFDFGKINDEFYDSDRMNHCRPDGYSTYAILDGNYISKMPFRPRAVENNKKIVEHLWFLAGTIAGELFFPAHMIGCSTINQARGRHPGINDMMYQTLESIGKYYCGEQDYYPLKAEMEIYGYFFDSFGSFDEYIEYNFLQDRELLPKKFPTNEDELIEFWERSISFLEARLKRIEEYARRNSLFDL